MNAYKKSNADTKQTTEVYSADDRGVQNILLSFTLHSLECTVHDRERTLKRNVPCMGYASASEINARKCTSGQPHLWLVVVFMVFLFVAAAATPQETEPLPWFLVLLPFLLQAGTIRRLFLMKELYNTFVNGN